VQKKKLQGCVELGANNRDVGAEVVEGSWGSRLEAGGRVPEESTSCALIGAVYIDLHGPAVM
jgi:hypothetical protein